MPQIAAAGRERARRRAATLVVVHKLTLPLLVLLACKPGIKGFNVDPPCVCKGADITMKWEVAHGRPQITVDHPPDGWTENQAFECSGSRRYHAQHDAEFVMTVPGANQANGDGRRRQSVTVVDGQTPASAIMPDCSDTGPDRAVTGPMPTVSSCGAPVARMHDPVVQATVGESIVNAPRRVCLVRPDGQSLCVDPGANTPVGAVVGEGWKIKVPLQDSERCDGGVPGLATVQFDIDCAKVAPAKG